MGIGETLKDYYYKAEDAWYKFVDKVSDKLPVFGTIVDKIEEKKIPTFPVAIALVLILLFVILFLLFGTSSALTVIVKDSNGNIVSAAQVTLYESGTQVDFRETDTTGKAIFYVQNSKYSIKVDKQGYTSLTKNDLTPSEINFVLAAIDEQITKTISLKNSSGQLINGTGTVVYSCVGSSEQRYSNYENGKFNADFTDCAEIQIDSISGYTIIEGKASFSSADNIILDEVEQTTSTVTVQLNSVGNELPTGLKVMLYDNEKVLFNTAYSNSNVVVFSNVVTNSYYVVVSDPSGEFNDYDGSTLGEIKELRKNEPISFSVNLTKSVSSSINITVKDAETGLPISGVEVKRKSTTNQNDLDTLITGNSGQVTFLVPQGSSYLITAEHPNYLIGDGKTVSANESATFNLIEANESNSQTLLVRVKDPQGAGISGTRVVLKRTDDTIVDEKITGYNGEVEFYNLEFGSYFVFATKTGFASVTTPSTQVLPRENNTIDVVLDIGIETVRLNVMDESGVVAGASVKAINVTGEIEKEASTDGEGKVDFSIRLDKEIYFLIEAANKASYYTTIIKPDSGVLTEKNILLKDSTGGLNIILDGIYSGNEEVEEDSEVINSGKYTAKLLLEVPKGNYTEAGVHIRTGKAENNTTNLMEEDAIAIGKILASTTKTTKGKTFTPPNGYSTDSANLTQSNSKWANIIWNNPTNAIYEIEAEIIVTDSLLNSVENFWYRAWTKGSTNLKNPISNTSGHELYSNAKVRLFSLDSSVGTKLCSGSFCKIYSIETLTGKNAGRRQGLSSTFNAQQNNTYVLTADLINTKSISQAVLELDARGIIIEEIKVNNAVQESQTINLGGLANDSLTKLEITFSTNTSGSATIDFKINSASKTEFSDSINVNIIANKKFNLDIIPKQLIPYIDNTLFFTVTENEIPLSRAVIEIKNQSSTLRIIETNGEGLAQFELTSPNAGDEFTIIAKKEGYETITLNKTVDERILLITPNQINETIKIGEITSIDQTIILTNQTIADLKIKKISTSGDLA
ncbi:MAG: carboxypeptidase-like regulatory domain-containing protein, partial [Candidatus ainarchaeum sp.]|nr:carboxypeptidase-like regulatory domain-containing protein [Candidatus ainarchaeum sp.]